MESKKSCAVSLPHFNDLISPHEAAELLNMASGTIKNKCAAGELFCKKIGKQWVLNKNYLQELTHIEVWKHWSKEFGYFLAADEIESYVMPEIEPRLYFEINKEELADHYDIDIEELVFDDIDWDREQEKLGEMFEEVAVKLDDFDQAYASSKGYKMPTEHDEIFRAWSYHDSGLNWKIIWEFELESSTSYRITEDDVCLDEWDGRNWGTGRMGEHQYVHRIVYTDFDEAEYLIVCHSQWQGEQPTVIKAELSLEGVLDYIANIDDGQERDLNDYKKKLLELFRSMDTMTEEKLKELLQKVSSMSLEEGRQYILSRYPNVEERAFSDYSVNFMDAKDAEGLHDHNFCFDDDGELMLSFSALCIKTDDDEVDEVEIIKYDEGYWHIHGEC